LGQGTRAVGAAGRDAPRVMSLLMRNVGGVGRGAGCGIAGSALLFMIVGRIQRISLRTAHDHGLDAGRRPVRRPASSRCRRWAGRIPG
jgi:hypothetical protein